MFQVKELQVSDLIIDLNNFRTVPQKDEINAINSMISLNPKRFWGLMDSLIETDYLPTENIIILEIVEKDKNKYIVKEGNRRIACLKILLGLVDLNQLNISQNKKDQIKNLPKEWYETNSKVNCSIYPESEIDKVNKIISLAHGKKEVASRDDWESVATARHNRQVNGAIELGLTLLEKYLDEGLNITKNEKILWSGKYSLTILDEALIKIHSKLGYTAAHEMVNDYPKIMNRELVEKILHDIGDGKLTFKNLRSNDFFLKYEINSNSNSNSDLILNKEENNQVNSKENNLRSAPENIKVNNHTPKRERTSTSISSTKNVTKLLKQLIITGSERSKILAIRNEMTNLKIENNPFAFCFLLRCLFELSAKVFCNQLQQKKIPNAPQYMKNNEEKKLVDVLRDITDFLTINKSDKLMVKKLHGAMTEISRSDGILSVTSLNQLVHNPQFSVAPNDISIIFSNIFPLLDEMNK